MTGDCREGEEECITGDWPLEGVMVPEEASRYADISAFIK